MLGVVTDGGRPLVAEKLSEVHGRGIDMSGRPYRRPKMAQKAVTAATLELVEGFG